MIDHVIAIYTIVDDLLKAIGHTDDCRAHLSDSEVITTALTASLYFAGNIEHARCFMKDTALIPSMLSKSRFNRRLHRVADLVFNLFHQLGSCLKEASTSTRYLLDSFPVSVCDNIRIARSRLVQGEEFRGKIASKRRYFYGVKVQVLTTEDGIPVEFAFVPGQANDTRGLDVLPLELPKGSQVFMDAGYTDYTAEDIAKEMDQISFQVQRKTNSKRCDPPWIAYYKELMRKRVETVFSVITAMFPRHIHAVTFRGFLIKVSMFIVGFTLRKAFI
jgi:hypothetical protein